MFRIVYHPDAAEELRAIRVFDRVRILDDILEQLTLRPHVIEGRKKRIELGEEDFILQLRVGAYRVFYDVDAEALEVIVRHVRRKGRRTTREIL